MFSAAVTLATQALKVYLHWSCFLLQPDICKLEPEVGLCRAYIPSYFYNSTSGTCERFIYGGCGGNDNR